MKNAENLDAKELLEVPLSLRWHRKVLDYLKSKFRVYRFYSNERWLIYPFWDVSYLPE